MRRLRGLLQRLLRAILACLLPLFAGAQEGWPVEELEQTRRAYLDYWEELGASGAEGLDRFAQLVQHVVDTRAREERPDQEVVPLIVDDLVDLFVGEAYQAEKQLVMRSPSVLGEDVIAEGEGDLEGFAERFRAGEGRFRHFAMNAAASLMAPQSLVELAARLRGGDLHGDSPDSLADRESNRIGLAFVSLLQEKGPQALADGQSVRNWLLESFGP